MKNKKREKPDYDPFDKNIQSYFASNPNFFIKVEAKIYHGSPVTGHLTNIKILSILKVAKIKTHT